jgi:hypothetical protein
VEMMFLDILVSDVERYTVESVALFFGQGNPASLPGRKGSLGLFHIFLPTPYLA